MVHLGEPGAEGSRENGGVEPPELVGDRKLGMMDAGDGGGELIEAIVVGLGKVGCACHQRCRVASENVVEKGDGFKAEAVATMNRIPVAGIFPEGQVVGANVGVDLVPADTEEWAEQGETVVELGDR